MVHLPTLEILGETMNLIGIALGKKIFSYKKFSKLHLEIQWWCLSCGVDIRVKERDWKLPYLYIDFVYH